MTIDDVTTTRLLRELDAAGGRVDGAHRADTLERILATDPTSVSEPVPPRTSRARLVVGGLVAAAVVTVAAVAVPAFTRSSRAFATWSPTPVEMQGATRAQALRACATLQGGDVGRLAFDPEAAAAEVAEARGGWDYVVFTATGGSGRELRGTCLMPDGLVDRPVAGKGGFFGSLDELDDTAGPAPAPDVARESSSGAGSVDGDLFVYLEGEAGADVVGIEVTTPRGQRVTASIDDGHWAVWWPAGDDSPRNPDIAKAPSYEVTLRDGSTTGMKRATE